MRGGRGREREAYMCAFGLCIACERRHICMHVCVCMYEKAYVYFHICSDMCTGVTIHVPFTNNVIISLQEPIKTE